MLASHHHELNKIAYSKANMANIKELVEATGAELVFLHRVSEKDTSHS